MELWRTGLLGAPMEYLNFRGVRRMRQRFDGDILRYWQEVQSLRTSPNGVFGVKIFVQNYEDISKQYQTLLPKLAFDDVIYLTRRDKVSQAVSYFRAIQTRAWFAGARVHQAPAYDFEGIARCEALVSRQETAWEQLFDITGSAPLRLHYEDLLADVPGVVQQVAERLHVSLSPGHRLDLPSLDRQADRLSDDWRERYREDRAATAGARLTAPRDASGPGSAVLVP